MKIEVVKIPIDTPVYLVKWTIKKTWFTKKIQYMDAGTWNDSQAISWWSDSPDYIMKWCRFTDEKTARTAAIAASAIVSSTPDVIMCIGKDCQ